MLLLTRTEIIANPSSSSPQGRTRGAARCHDEVCRDVRSCQQMLAALARQAAESTRVLAHYGGLASWRWWRSPWPTSDMLQHARTDLERRLGTKERVAPTPARRQNMRMRALDAI